MALTDAELERWRTRQIHALVARGVYPLDAHAQVTRFLAKVPVGADPNNYVPDDNFASIDLMSKEVRADANGDWYGKVDARFARLLDAKGTE